MAISKDIVKHTHQTLHVSNLDRAQKCLHAHPTHSVSSSTWIQTHSVWDGKEIACYTTLTYTYRDNTHNSFTTPVQQSRHSWFTQSWLADVQSPFQSRLMGQLALGPIHHCYKHISTLMSSKLSYLASMCQHLCSQQWYPACCIMPQSVTYMLIKSDTC